MRNPDKAPTIHPAGPGQESVWDYPRPPRLERFDGHVQVVFAGRVLADTRNAIRVLETSHPPNYYIPLADVDAACLALAPGTSFCEWKGAARYYDVRLGDWSAPRAAWFYPEPTTSFEALRDHVSFYPSRMDACRVNGETVKPQPGRFYGGWITANVVGPFKGEPGTESW